MPYINAGIRESLDEGRKPQNGGELNYLVTKIVDGFLTAHGLSYAAINEVVGALECAKLEAYRRVAAPYEDKKIKLNGEVYGAVDSL